MDLNRPPRVRFNDAVTRHPVYDGILSSLSAVSLVRMRRVNRMALQAVKDYSERAFDINRRLSRFFSDPVTFRCHQARSNFLISGSFALQFFDRSFYPESDLDIYVPVSSVRSVAAFLQNEGYIFTPASWQPDDFEEAWSNRAEWIPTPVPDFNLPGLTPTDVRHLEHYRMKGIGEVFTFSRPVFGDADTVATTLKVQVIIPKHIPLEVILGFHSTCVMNIITYNAAYSLYPYATFEQRQSFALQMKGHEGRALRKYASRGWRIVAASSHLATSPSSRFFVGEARWVNGSNSWIIPLDVEGIRTPGPPSVSSVPLTWDPVAECSWTLKGDLMVYRKTSSYILRYCYTVANREYLDVLIDFCTNQGSLEFMKIPDNAPDNERHGGGEYWTWWDSEMPVLRDQYLQEQKEKEDLFAMQL